MITIILAVMLALGSVISIIYGRDIQGINTDWEGICFIGGGILGIIVSVVLIATYEPYIW